MRAGQAGTALGLGRLGRSSNCSSFIYHQGQGADRTYRAVLIGNHDPPLYRTSHPPRVVSTPGTIPRYKPLTMRENMREIFQLGFSKFGSCRRKCESKQWRFQRVSKVSSGLALISRTVSKG